MALFDDPTLLTDEKKTKDTLKAAFAKVNAVGTKFLYYEKVKIGAKEIPALALVDYTPTFESQFKTAHGKSPIARGHCRATDSKELAFHAETGKVKVDVLKKFMATVSGTRPVCEAVEAPAALNSPSGSKQAPPSAKSEPASSTMEPATAKTGAAVPKTPPVASKTESATSKTEPVTPKTESATSKTEPTAPKGAQAQSAPKSEASGVKNGAAKPDPALLKRLGVLSNDAKHLPGDLADSFLGQIKKAAALIQSGDEKQALAAAKLLDTLEPMVQKAESRQAPQVEEEALARARQSVVDAYAALPSSVPGLRADLEATAEAKAFAKVSHDPAQARLGVGASKLLLKKIADVRALAEAWPGTTAKATKQLDEAFQAARAEFAKSPGRVETHLQNPAVLTVKQLCADAGAYARGSELQQALQQQATALTELVNKIRAWDVAGKQAELDLKGDINALDNAYKKKVEQASVKDATYTTLGQLIKRGRTEVLEVSLLTQRVKDVRDRIAALADEERRRIRAADVKQRLQAHRPAVEQAILACTELIGRATAALPALEATWRTATVQADLTNDTNTVTGWRTATTTLRDSIDTALTALGAEPPPPALAITNAEGLLTNALPDLAATSQRVRRHLATTTAAGILAQLEAMFVLAQTNHHLSNTRIGNVRAALKKTPKTLALAQQDIDTAVAGQNRPKPGEWLKVLQMPNARPGGDLRVAKLGDTMLNGKRVPVHLTLYLANVDVNNSPDLGMTPAAIINRMLPDVVGSLGTHVTAEVYGDKSKNNPHYFKGAAIGVANGLAGNAEWGTVETDLRKLLNAEVLRLTGLVTNFVANHGVWPGD